jgi:hypothetical protein
MLDTEETLIDTKGVARLAVISPRTETLAKLTVEEVA